MLNTTHYRRLMLCVIVLTMGMAAGCSGNKSTIGKDNTTERYEILKQEAYSKFGLKNQMATLENSETYSNLYTFLYASYKEEVEVAKFALKKLDLSAEIFDQPITTSLLMAASIPPEGVEEEERIYDLSESMGIFRFIERDIYRLIGDCKNWKGDKVIEAIIAAGLEKKFVDKMREVSKYDNINKSLIEHTTFHISLTRSKSFFGIDCERINFSPVVGHNFVKNCIKLDSNIFNSGDDAKENVKRFYILLMQKLKKEKKREIYKIIKDCSITDWEKVDLKDDLNVYFSIEGGKIKIADSLEKECGL